MIPTRRKPKSANLKRFGRLNDASRCFSDATTLDDIRLSRSTCVMGSLKGAQGHISWLINFECVESLSSKPILSEIVHK